MLVQITTAIEPPTVITVPQGMKSTHRVYIDFGGRKISNDWITGNTFDIIPSARNEFAISNAQFLPNGAAAFTVTGQTAAGVLVLWDINYKFNVIVDSQGRGSISGCHDGYPSYQVIAANKIVYYFRQKGLPSLEGSCNETVSTRAF